jgi:hypothetical protein
LLNKITHCFDILSSIDCRIKETIVLISFALVTDEIKETIVFISIVLVTVELKKPLF